MARDMEGWVINYVAQMTVELNEFQNKFDVILTVHRR